MCGIVGMARRDRGGFDPTRTAAALQCIRHRGPDAQGSYQDGALWLGHVRLSILDLSAAGNQPMATPDSDLVIVYNGEIYNFRELAAELSLSGLRSRSDTEVILHAFRKLGPAAFAKFNGMFAFALYEKSTQKLWLVRDRLGIKPLYFRLDGEGLAFSSEIKGILALAEGTPSCDPSTLHEWLYYGNALGGRTLYRGIEQLLPGHYLELDLKSFRHTVVTYWSLQHQANGGSVVRASTAEMILETRRLFEEAVRRQLVSDVPVGVFLSGGVDSSAVTAMASRHYSGRLATYAAGFDDLAGVDERPKARRVAEHFGTEHHELHIAGADLPDLVEKMVHHHDMPFSDAANIPLYLMAARISSTTKVVLQGDGGDELFGGYRRYVSLRHRELFRLLARVGRRFEDVLPESFFYRRVRRYVHAFASGDLATTMARLLTPVDPQSSPDAVFARGFREALGAADPFARYRHCQPQFAHHDAANQMLMVDLMVELPDIFLEKVDRSTMAASLEVRVPFLDHDLIDYVVRIPRSRKMPWGRKKWLLKQALHGVVPHDVLYGPKTGFSVPFGYWLRTSLKPLFFGHLDRFARERPGVLDVQAIQSMYAAMEAGAYDRSNTLWNVLNLMIWCNQTGVRFSPGESNG
jgi:asparagine synthase (glutamine-hydrolysing)